MTNDLRNVIPCRRAVRCAPNIAVRGGGSSPPSRLPDHFLLSLPFGYREYRRSVSGWESRVITLHGAGEWEFCSHE